MSLPYFRLKFQSIQMDSTSKYTIKTSISSRPLDSLTCSSLSRLYSTNFISSIYSVNHLTGYHDTVFYIFPLLLKASTKKIVKNLKMFLLWNHSNSGSDHQDRKPQISRDNSLNFWKWDYRKIVGYTHLHFNSQVHLFLKLERHCYMYKTRPYNLPLGIKR